MIADGLWEGKKERVMEDTWGHLAPEIGRRYEGWMVIAASDRESIVVDYDFGDLPGSPWFHSDQMAFVDGLVEKFGVGVYRWDGRYEKLKDGNCRFAGTSKRIEI